MAYLIELEETDITDTDIPTTIIRSKTEVPQNTGDTQTLNTNDIVINKLAQILSYLRQGGRGKKNKKRDKDKPLFKVPEDKDIPSSSKSRSNNVVEDSIYGDIGDYKPSRSSGGSSSSSRRDEKRRDHHSSSSKSSSDRDRERDRDRDRRDKRSSYFDKPIEPEERVTSIPTPQKLSNHLITKLTSEPEGYNECYPGKLFVSSRNYKVQRHSSRFIFKKSLKLFTKDFISYIM